MPMSVVKRTGRQREPSRREALCLRSAWFSTDMIESEELSDLAVFVTKRVEARVCRPAHGVFYLLRTSPAMIGCIRPLR